MKKRPIFAFICGIVGTLILATGLRLFAPSPVVAQTNSNLIVSAAASLKEALQAVQQVYQQTKPDVSIKYNFAASGPLQQQIENGAPVDVFVSAAEKQMNALEKKGLILKDTRRDLLTNTLVLIVPQNSSAITDFRQLAGSDVKKIAVGEPRSVPAGQYAEEVFKNLGILSQVKPKLVLGNSVRQVLTFVASGNVDAGLVYATDAKISPQVKVVATAAENLHSPITYPVAVLKNSRNVQAAKEYVQFLSSNQTSGVFQKYGFGIAR